MTSATYKRLAGENGQLLGAHVLYENATGLINSFILVMIRGMAVNDLSSSV